MVLLVAVVAGVACGGPTRPVVEVKTVANDREKPVTRETGTLIHVVSATGPGGSRERHTDQWSLGVGVQGWCVDEETEIRSERLYLRQPGLTSEALRAAFARIPRLTPLAMRVGPLRAVHNRLEADILAVVGRSEHPIVVAKATELTQPVTIEDDVLGTLTLDRPLGSFEGRARWSGREIRVNVNGESVEAARANLDTAHELFANQEEWAQRVLEQATVELLDLHNESWSESPTPKTAAEFQHAMTLQSISIAPNGRFEFWFDDGDLFAGHLISVRGSLDRGPFDASIQG